MQMELSEIELAAAVLGSVMVGLVAHRAFQSMNFFDCKWAMTLCVMGLTFVAVLQLDRFERSVILVPYVAMLAVFAFLVLLWFVREVWRLFEKYWHRKND